MWIWLEEIKDCAEPVWTIERYGTAARCLGSFNGAYLIEQPLPDYARLGRHLLRESTSNLPIRLEYLRKGHGPAKKALSGPLMNRIQRFLAEREELLDRLYTLPRTLCHFDMKRGNLLTRSTTSKRERVAAVDWSCIGFGAIDEDSGCFLAGILFSTPIEPDNVTALTEVLLDNYLAGLRDAGWADDPQIVRLGYIASAAIRLTSHIIGLIPYALHEDLRDFHENLYGCSVDELVDRWVGSLQLLYDVADRELS